MKSMRKLASLLLALAMIFALATTAFAAGTNSITVNNTVAKETYTIYKMLDLVVNDPANPTAFSYTVAEGWNAFFTTGAGKDYVTITNNYVTWNDNKKSESDMIAFGQAAKAVATGGTPKVADGTSVAFTGLDNGYYLITSTLGTQAIVNSTPSNKNADINEKNPKDTITKEVQEDDGGAWGESNDAQIGDTVNFKSTATLHPYTTNVKIHDTMTDGLTLNTDSIVVGNLTVNTDYTVAFNTDDGCDFEITFTPDYLKDLTDDPTVLTITYSAILNENAVDDSGDAVAFATQTNKTKITYGDQQSAEDSTTTTTHKFSVFKHYTTPVEGGEPQKTLLPGAEFSLMKNGVVVKLINIDDTNYRVADADDTGVDTFTTVNTGNIVIWGVDSDNDYTLKEITAPNGYNLLKEEFEVTVNADNSFIAAVENKTGTELPSTGGMGTTLFYIVGGVLVAAAVVLLVTKKRMASAN